MFGNQLLMPVPDVDRSDLFICLGANPLASNGSIMTAPDMRRRLKAIRERGGRVIVLDPRRTETAERADRHLFMRPGHRRGAAARDDPRDVRREAGAARAARRDLAGTGELRAAAAWLPAGARRDHRRRAGDDPRARARARDAPRARALRPDRRVHAGVRRARGVAVLRDQRADRPPRRAGRPDVHDAGGRSGAARRRSARTAGSRAGAAGCRAARVRRRAAG